jgi:hypothetical protein
MTTKRTRPTAASAHMKIPAEALYQNAILIGLDAPQVEVVTKHGALVNLEVRAPIYKPDERIKDVFFPIDCVPSIVTRDVSRLRRFRASASTTARTPARCPMEIATGFATNHSTLV